MAKNQEQIDFLLRKYIQNTCTKQELDEFWKLLSRRKWENELTEEMYVVWEGLSKNLSIDAAKVDEAYDKFLLKSRREDSLSNALVTRKIKRKKIVRWALAAAIFAGFLTGGIYLYTARDQPVDPELSVVENRSASKSDEPALKVIALPDQSSITLNSNSRLQYDTAFKERKVTLKGEAFFDVTHDASRPFVVYAGDYSIHVLGTSFNVKEARDGIEVTVIKGKVRVEDMKQNKDLGIILPGLQLRANRIEKTEDVVEKEVAVSEVTAWSRLDLVFDNATWEEAASVIKDRYGVQVEFENSAVKQCRFTGDFSNKSLNDCLDIITLLTHTVWQKVGTDIIKIEGDGCL